MRKIERLLKIQKYLIIFCHPLLSQNTISNNINNTTRIKFNNRSKAIIMIIKKSFGVIRSYIKHHVYLNRTKEY